MAEFLVQDFFPWTGVKLIGCFDYAVATKVAEVLKGSKHRPAVEVQSAWYYP
jgi:hypothetical protein